MKIKKEFVKREIAGDIILVPLGAAVYDYNGLFAMNELGGFLWDRLPGAEHEDDLVHAVLEEYEAEEAQVRQDVGEFLNKLREMDIL